jgi:tRNA (cmo5U34)-methyltransferase
MSDKWIPGSWTFHNREVAKRFDSHVRETLPWYDLATHGTSHLIKAYTPENGLIYDIGASTGNIGRSIAGIVENRKIELIGIENSREMKEMYNSPGEIVIADAVDYQYKPFDVAVLFLTLMFIPVKKREILLDTLHERLNPGGAIIIVDKIPLLPGYLGSTIHRWTMKQKQIGGISPAEIAEKELSLVGVQRPLDVESHLIPRGYNKWLQVGEFAGFIFEKSTPVH